MAGIYNVVILKVKRGKKRMTSYLWNCVIKEINKIYPKTGTNDSSVLARILSTIETKPFKVDWMTRARVPKGYSVAKCSSKDHMLTVMPRLYDVIGKCWTS